MKPTHIVYNPEGKPDGLYVITEMPTNTSPITTCSWYNKNGCTNTFCNCAQKELAYNNLVQAAISSANIKVRDEDEYQIMYLLFKDQSTEKLNELFKDGKNWFWSYSYFDDESSAKPVHPTITIDTNNPRKYIEPEQGKVYELSGIELETYAVCETCNKQGLRNCAHPEECNSWKELARIKTIKVEPKVDVFDTGARLPKQEEQTSKIERSDLFYKLLSIVQLLTLAKTEGDTYDHPSIAVKLEELFKKQPVDPIKEETILKEENERLEFRIKQLTERSDFAINSLEAQNKELKEELHKWQSGELNWEL